MDYHSTNGLENDFIPLPEFSFLADLDYSFVI